MKSVSLIALLSLALPKLAIAAPLEKPFTLYFLNNKGFQLDLNEGSCVELKEGPGVPPGSKCSGGITLAEATTEPRQFMIMKGDCAVMHEVWLTEVPSVERAWFTIEWDEDADTATRGDFVEGNARVPYDMKSLPPPEGAANTGATLKQCGMSV